MVNQDDLDFAVEQLKGLQASLKKVYTISWILGIALILLLITRLENYSGPHNTWLTIIMFVVVLGTVAVCHFCEKALASAKSSHMRLDETARPSGFEFIRDKN